MQPKISLLNLNFMETGWFLLSSLTPVILLFLQSWALAFKTQPPSLNTAAAWVHFILI